MLPEIFGPIDFQAIASVSRETLARLTLFVDLLEDWNRGFNLVSTRSLSDVWRRHIWDSAQLAALIPADIKTVVDLGSGAGFPGIVLATMLAAPIRVVLYESVTKKCRFLEEAARQLALAVEVRNARAETAGREPFDVVTARACAPLPQLLTYTLPFQGDNTVCLFLKGLSVEDELTEAYKSWSMRVDQHRSRSDPSGVILEIRELRHVTRRAS